MSKISIDSRYLKDKAAKLKEIVEKLGDSEKDLAGREQLFQVLRLSERIGLACREYIHELENVYEKPDIAFNNMNMEEADMVSIYQEDGHLAVRVPYLLNRRADDCWYLKDAVWKKVRTYCRENSFTVDVNQRYVLVIERIEEKQRNDLFDNDNTEAHQICDSICRGVGISDQPFRIQHYFTTIVSTVTQAGTYLHLIPEPYFPSFIEKEIARNEVRDLGFIQERRSERNLPDASFVKVQPWKRMRKGRGDVK